MRFSRLKLEGWRQFLAVDLEFHERVTIITGANGAGKSTLIRILAQHFGWHMPLLATPTQSKDGMRRYLSGFWSKLSRSGPVSQSIGEIHYSNGHSSQLVIPQESGVQYSIEIRNAQTVSGLQISSHRPQSSYQPVGNIPTDALSVEQAYQAYFNEVVNKYNNSYTNYSPVYRMKEAIISMAVFGPGNADVAPNPTMAMAYEKFKMVLREVLPDAIGFLDIQIRIPDVVIVTKSGEFMIDAASGGLMSLIDLAWQIFLYSYDKDEIVILLDEPENHLHPSMQRQIVGDLVRAFPKAQFVIVTHSPFVVSSVRDSNVYVLRHVNDESETPGSQRTVSSIRLDKANKAGTASEILRDVLGVPVTLPDWAEDEIRQISSAFTMDQLNADGIKQLRARLEAAGLGEYYPDALHEIAGRA